MSQQHRGVPAYPGALLCVAAATALIRIIPGAEHIANISMVYLLAVIAGAVFFGRGPAIVASVASFLAFDWFFVEPRHTFTVSDPGEWLALLTFLVTAATTGHLTALLRARADEARQREREAEGLAEASWAVASQVGTEAALGEVLRRLGELIPARRLTLRTGMDGRLETLSAWEADRAVPPGAPSSVQIDEFPLRIEERMVGLLQAELRPEASLTRHQRRIAESLANHAAVILERDRLTRAAAHAQALEEAGRLKAALLSMVSHDFRSPLTGIKVSVTSLLEQGQTPDPAGQRELLFGIDHETDRLNRMVGNILALSRLEAGAWQPRREATGTAELIGTALASFSAAQNARIRVDLREAPEELSVDPVQIVQVLRNLVENALKYSPDTSPVRIQARRTDEGPVIAVTDLGPGLPPGEEERIFEPFHRAADQRESAVEGVGLGLAVCRGLVEAHGGRLEARNGEAAGAVFEIRLPPQEENDATPGSR